MIWPLDNNGKSKNMRLNDQPKIVRPQFRIKNFWNIFIFDQNEDKA